MNILFISRAYSAEFVRLNNIEKYLLEHANTYVLNLANRSFFCREFKSNILIILQKVLNRILIFPDKYLFLTNTYKRHLKVISKTHQFDVVIIGILPFSFLSLTSEIKRHFSQAKLVVDMTDPITCNLNWTKYSQIRKSYLSNFEDKYIRYIDFLIVLNQEIAEHYRKKYPSLFEVNVIEQGVERIDLVKVQRNKYQILTLIYAGIFIKKRREPYNLYSAVMRYSGKIMLRLFGALSPSPIIKDVFRPPNSERFFDGGRINREQLFREYSESDVIVILDNLATKQIPGKILEVLSMNKPVLFVYYDNNSPSLNYLKQFRGIYYSLNNIEDIFFTLNQIFNDNCFHYKRDVSEYYWDNLLKKYLSILTK